MSSDDWRHSKRKHYGILIVFKMATPRKIASDYLNKNVAGSFGGLRAFTESSGVRDKKKIRDVLAGVEAYSLNRPTRKPKTRSTLIFFPYMTYVVDLLQLSQKEAKRERFSFILICLDGFR